MSSGHEVLEPGVRGLRVGRWSVLLHGRALRSLLLLAVALVGLSALSMAAGSTWLSTAELIRAVAGDSTAGTALLLWEFRWPRVVLALLAGAALGLSGCLLQALMRNRLASPDLMGVTDGATLLFTVFLMIGTTGQLGPWWIGVLGAAAAVVLLLLSAGGLGRHGQRILVVGLAVSNLLHAVTELLLSRQSLQHAGAIYAWSVGSLNGRGLASALPLALGLAVVLPCAWLCARRLVLLGVDAELAAALGVRPRVVQWQAWAMAVTLAGLAVGLCGPIAFVALAAPLMAARLPGATALPLSGAALSGAGLVLAADTAGRVLLSGTELPVGVICNLIGGPLLLCLLLARRPIGHH